ncbi:MAG: Sec-independent protein translocase protein TatB [Gammaproteobacteria bacterium]|nr:twin-arginine translocase subunit TatB [Gammaproteobacteria bacterium]
MFEVGFTEIVLILGLALLVLGPERLPELARKVGRWTGRARAMARQLHAQLEQEVTLEELARSRPTQPTPSSSYQGSSDTNDVGGAAHEPTSVSSSSPETQPPEGESSTAEASTTKPSQ